jgi:hypothetical protein
MLRKMLTVLVAGAAVLSASLAQAETVAVCMAKDQARCTGFGIGPYNKFLTISVSDTSVPSAELRARQAVCKMDQPIKTTKTVAALPQYAYFQFDCKKL